MTVTRMLREMTVREFALWRIRFAEQPWGESRADFRTAQLCALTANVNRDPKRRTEPFTALDFMPYDQREREADEAAEAADKPKDIIRPETRDWFYRVAVPAKATDGN